MIMIDLRFILFLRLGIWNGKSIQINFARFKIIESLLLIYTVRVLILYIKLINRSWLLIGWSCIFRIFVWVIPIALIFSLKLMLNKVVICIIFPILLIQYILSVKKSACLLLCLILINNHCCRLSWFLLIYL